MDIEKALLGQMIEDQNLTDVVNAGITPQHFETEENRRIFQWAQEYRERYSQDPGPEALKRDFPTFRIKRAPEDEPTSALIDRLKKQHKRAILTMGLAQANGLVGGRSPDLDTGIEVLRDTLDVLDTANDTSEVISITDLLTRPSPSYLIDDWLPNESTGFLFGQWGSYKSFIALDMAMSIATGREWQGHEVKQGRVLYAVGEGQGGFPDRVKAWCRHHAVNASAAPIDFVMEPIPLNDPSSVGRLRGIQARGNYSLVVFDTLSRMTPGSSENDNAEMAEAIAVAESVRPASVLILHHPSKGNTKSLRGASALGGNVDVILRAEKTEQGDGVTLTVEKAKDGPDDGEMFLLADPVEGWPSLILRRGEVPPDQSLAHPPSEILEIVADQPNHRFTMGELVGRSDVPRTTVQRRVKALIDAGEICHEGNNKETRYWYPSEGDGPVG